MDPVGHAVISDSFAGHCCCGHRFQVGEKARRHGDELLCLGCGEGREVLAAELNADLRKLRLEAAAPELLKALKEMIDHGENVDLHQRAEALIARIEAKSCP